MFVKHEVTPVKPAGVARGTNWSMHALEWIGLLPALGVCAWVILNFG